MKKLLTGRLERALSAVVAIGLLAALTVAQPGGTATALCPLEPTLQDVSINQGLQYPTLVRGKRTLVRLYLSMPQCADPSTQYVELRSAKLTVKAVPAIGAPVDLTTVDSTPVPTQVYPRLAPYARTVPDWTGDPKFVIEGSALAPVAISGPYTLSLTAELSYQASDGLGARTKTLSFLDTPSLRAPVGGPTNPLRVLVVPMGDTASGAPDPYPSGAESSLLNTLQTLNRTMPVADGVTDLTATTGGLRYRRVPSVLNLGSGTGGLALMNGPKGVLFCGGSANFEAIKSKLAAFLQDWNSMNPSTPADRVLGVVWQASSKGISSNCAEGWASIGGQEGWARLVDGDVRTSISGTVATMEIAHTFSAVPIDRDNDFDGHHSPNTAADADPSRSYYVTNGEYLPDARSAMKLQSTGWTNYNTLLEKPDWAMVQCRLTPTATAYRDCPAPGATGSAGAAARFVLSGTTTVTASVPPTQGYTDAHSYYAAEEPHDQDPTSPYSLVQLGSNPSAPPLQVDRVPVRFVESNHSATTADSDYNAPQGLFDYATTVASGVSKIQLRHDAYSAPLYEVVVNNEPTITSSAIAAQELRTAGPGTDPALSTDGEWLVWSEGGRLKAQPTGGGAPVVDTGVAGSQPALSPVAAADGSRKIAFIRNGDVYTGTFKAGAITAAPLPLYLSANQDELRQIVGDTAAGHPSWSADDRHIAVDIAGDIWSLDGNFVPTAQNPLVCGYLKNADPCHALTAGRHSVDPAWASDGRIAFADTTTGHLVVQKDGVNSDSGLTGTAPSFGGSVITFVGGNGSIWTADATTFGNTTQVTVGADAAPTVDGAGHRLALGRTVNGASSIKVFDLDHRQIVVRATDEFPSRLRLDGFLVCGGAVPPIFADQVPVVVGNEAVFTVEYDARFACAGGVVRARVTDGYRTKSTDLGQVPPVPDTTTRFPAGAIYSPGDGSAIFQYDGIMPAGLAVDQSGAVADNRMRWFLVSPSGARRSAGTGTRPGQQTPSAGGWEPGTWTIGLDILDPTLTAPLSTVVSHFTVKPDADNDHRSPGNNASCAGGIENDNDPKDAFGDPDHDGYYNVEDSDPCVSANNAAVNFDPDSLNLPSSGTPITLYVTSSSVKLGQFSTPDVRISRIGSYYVSDGFGALSWTVDSTGTGVAKFDRQKVTQFMYDHGLLGMYVPVVISGSHGTATFRGLDANSPTTSSS